MPDWLAWAGGIGVVRPGQTYIFSVELEAGRYYVIDRSFQGRSNDFASLDARAQLEVTPTERRAALPAAAGSITVTDGGFAPRDLAAGAVTVLLENAGDEPHDFVISPILAGKTLEDVKTFATSDDSGPPPVDLEREVISGNLSAGMKQTIRVEFAPGTYALLCFASDLAGGPPHVVTGELTDLTIE